MQVLKWLVAGFFLAFANVALATAVSCSSSNLYAEDGDAGDRYTPQNVTGGPYCGFSGDIGGPVIIVIGDQDPFFGTDTTDAFRFFFTGGHFAGVYDSSASAATRELYADDDRNNPISHSGDDWGTLVAGTYVFEVSLPSDDPPYTFSLFDLTRDPLPLRDPNSVPAPAPLALMLAGLAGLAASRRRRTA